MRTLGLLAGAVLALAGCAGNETSPLTISDVSVEADLPAVGSPEAVAYWQNLSNDLQTAIAGQYVGRVDPAGRRIDVDIDELSLQSPFVSGATAETAKLSGRVTLINPDGTSEATYDVTATSQDVATYLPPGSTLVSIPPTSADYYRAIVQAFAVGTATTLDNAVAAGS
jgi:hypothetical protein